MTLDYDVDLRFFNELDQKFNFDSHGRNYTEKLIKFLDENPNLTNINIDSKIRYKTDENLIKEIKRHTTIAENFDKGFN